jgi:hypothetical protein
VVTTITGMPAPSMVQPPALAPTATSAQSVDRAALTNSYVPDVPRPPQNDTSAMVAGYGGTLASSAAAPVQPVAFRWPPEQPPARSEEPQVRTLSGMPLAPTRSVAPVVAAVVLMVVLALASVALVVVVRLRSSRPDAAAKQPTVTAPSATPPAPQPVVVMPAPTLPPPALDDTPAPTAAPVASASSVASQTPVATSKPVLPVKRPPVTPSPLARPGPGF